MTTDEKIKLVRGAIERVHAAGNNGATRDPLKSWEWTEVRLARNAFAKQWQNVKAILDEREAEREVVEKAVEWLRWADPDYTFEVALEAAVRRLLEVRKEREQA